MTNAIDDAVTCRVLNAVICDFLTPPLLIIRIFPRVGPHFSQMYIFPTIFFGCIEYLIYLNIIYFLDIFLDILWILFYIFFFWIFGYDRFLVTRAEMAEVRSRRCRTVSTQVLFLSTPLPHQPSTYPPIPTPILDFQ